MRLTMNFEAMATPASGDEVQVGDSAVPLYDLSIALMRRLLLAGLLDLPTWRLKSIVKRFVAARCVGKDPAVAKEVFESLLPPHVLLNCTNRRTVVNGGGAVEARDFAA